MFGLGLSARKKYNQQVDDILTKKLQIEVDQTKNPNFPGILKYLEMIDEVWHSKGSAEAAAIRVAMPYYSGLIKNGTDADHKEAQILGPRFRNLMTLYRVQRAIDQERLDYYAKIFFKHTGLRIWGVVQYSPR